MGYNYTSIDGQRVETAVARSYAALEAEFRRVFGLDLIISSGTRTRAEQEYLYHGWINRLPGFNLAAKPGTSNHEEGGPAGPRALDVRDSGGDAGVTVVGSHRSNWLRDNCGRFGFVNAGLTFNPKEAWHIEYRGALDMGGIPAGNGPITVDGEWGVATTSKLQANLGVTVDGQLGPETVSALQRGLGVPVDGQMGPQTISALQAKVGATVDGQLGPNTIRALQVFLNAGQKFTPDNGQLMVDGQWGPATTRKFQKSLGVTEDGELGPQTWTAFQNAVGITADGQPGPQTYKALQSNVGASVDGALGPETIKKLQEHLNAGKGWTKVELPKDPDPIPASPRTPTWPGAIRAWDVPLMYRLVDGKWELNTRKPATVVNRGINHHTGTTADQEAYFKSYNERRSCPHLYINEAAEAIELIPYRLKPSSTGAANEYSIAVEVENVSMGPEWGISDKQREKLAQFWAWVDEQEQFEGVKIEVVLTRTSIIGHNEAGVNATACPGPSMNLDFVVARAVELSTKPEPEPEPEPEEPSLNEKIKVAYDVLGKLIDQLGD